MNQFPPAFWSISVSGMLQNLESKKEGLTSDEAQKRLELYGSNLLKPKKHPDIFNLLISQFKSPIILWIPELLQAMFTCLQLPRDWHHGFITAINQGLQQK